MQWILAITSIIFTFPISWICTHYGARIPFFIAGIFSNLCTGLIPLAAAHGFKWFVLLRGIQVFKIFFWIKKIFFIGYNLCCWFCCTWYNLFALGSINRVCKIFKCFNLFCTYRFIFNEFCCWICRIFLLKYL